MSRGLVIGIAIWLVSIAIGVHIGKRKGRKEAAELLTIFLGVIGLLIVTLLPENREAKIAETQRQMEMQAEAARRAGYPWPPPPPPPSGPPPWPQGPHDQPPQ
jgi:hypothetical protein